MTAQVDPLATSPPNAGPLAGIGIIVTRPERQAAVFAGRIAALDGTPLIWPAVVIRPPQDETQLAHVHGNLDRYDIAIFVSANAVEFGARPAAAWPAHLRTYAPGPGTAEALAAAGIADTRIPVKSWDSEGLLELPDLADVAGKRIVIFRGEGGREFLGNSLRARGASVDHVPCYRRVAPTCGVAELLEAMRDGRADALTLTSGEGLDNLLAALGEQGRAALAMLPAFASHPRIAERAREHGLSAVETAGGDAGLLSGLLDWFAPGRSAAGTRKRGGIAMNDIDILVTASLPPFLKQPLESDYRCHDYLAAGERDALLARIGPRVRGLVQGGGTVTTTTLLDALPKLEIISVFGVGYDGVPTDYCRGRGIKVTNTPDVLTDDVADVAVALILMTGRGFVRANRFLHRGEWTRHAPELTTRLAGRSVGIVGLGRIGKAIAKRVEAMGMHVAYTGRRPQDVGYRYVPGLEALAAESDFLIVACPGGAATRHLIDARVLAALGSKGTLVNIARGSIVDEAALIRALGDGTIKAAALDVFENEPQVPQALLAMENVVLLPHVGSATHETRKAMADLCKANLDRWFTKRDVLTLVPELQ